MINPNESKILIINSGSTFMKFSLYLFNEYKLFITGKIHNIHLDNCSLTLLEPNETIPLHGQSVDMIIVSIIRILKEKEFIKHEEEIVAIGHNILTGGSKFNHSIIIDSNNLEDLLKIQHIAPLYNTASLLAYEGFLKVCPLSKHIAVFETAFHSTLPAEQFLFPIPYEYYEKHCIRKFGAHGHNYRYVLKKYNELKNIKTNNDNIIICHIDAGVSACAISNGKSVATTTGLTPLGGNMMATRSGDVDPSIIFQMAKSSQIPLDDVEYILNYQSGLKGITGLSTGNISIILKEIANKNERALISWKMFINNLISQIAKYYFLFQGNVQAIILTGEVIENSIELRKEILPVLKNTLGLIIENEKMNILNKEIRLTKNNCKTELLIIPADEDRIIWEDINNLVMKR